MTRDDMQKMKRFLSAVYPKYKNMTDDEVTGWYIILKPYTYEECRDAVVAYSRMSTLAPIVNEIANYIEAQRRQKQPNETHKMTDELLNALRQMKAYGDALAEYYHSFNLPTFPEYMKKHPDEPKHTVAWRTWDRLCTEAGADNPPKLRWFRCA